jgi:chromatin segregation and condensation protein Rec8/ScpA/Scc1 (kleisin family)
MENGFLPLASSVQRSFAAGVTGRKRDQHRGKVVMISSHPQWLHHTEVEDEIVADTVDLVRVFHEVLERIRRSPVLNMDDESVSVGQMIDHTWQRLITDDAPLRLSHLLRVMRSERAVICLELALLELVRLQAILLRQDHKLSDILLERNSALPGS